MTVTAAFRPSSSAARQHASPSAHGGTQRDASGKQPPMSTKVKKRKHAQPAQPVQMVGLGNCGHSICYIIVTSCQHYIQSSTNVWCSHGNSWYQCMTCARGAGDTNCEVGS